MTPAVRIASEHGVRFHQQPCGTWIATAGARRICGPPGRDWTQDLVANLMLAWLVWARVLDRRAIRP